MDSQLPGTCHQHLYILSQWPATAGCADVLGAATEGISGATCGAAGGAGGCCVWRYDLDEV